MNASKAKKYDELEHIQLLEQEIAYNRNTKALRTYNAFYDWQHQFNASTRTNNACMLMAANQVGKSLTGCVIDKFHLTGDYPDNWDGYRFTFPPKCWLLGYSGEKTRDLLQAKLFGQLINNEFQGGLIPREKILDKITMSGTSRAMREVKVQHTHGVSICQFWSYSQGQHALMGDIVDWYHIDEEPEDHEIYPQIITRTINGDKGKGGRGILTFTPENGKTELVCQFMDFDMPGQSMQTATWNDAPHLSEEKKATILNMYPAYQRDMRSKGVPLMGAGLIYEVDEDLVSVEPFKIPGHFKIIGGLDFGWDHPQALVRLAIDEENEIIYITHAFKRNKLHAYEAWRATKHWLENVPIAWPQDGYQSRSEGTKELEKRDTYIEEGFELLYEHTTWEAGGVSVTQGIVELNQLFKNGQLRIFSTLHEVFEELRQYHTKTNAKGNAEIVKLKDDLLDAIRYAYMMRREAVPLLELDEDMQVDDYYPVDDYGAMGY